MTLPVLCIGTRLFLTYLVKETRNPRIRRYLGWLLLAMSLGFIGLYFYNRDDVGLAVNKVWWHEWRLLHGCLYLTAAIYTLRQYPHAWVPLFIDTMLGVGIFIKHFCKTSDA